MIADRHSERCEPLSWVGSFPVYLATLIAAIHTAGVILTALGMAAWGMPAENAVLRGLVFSWREALVEGQIWRFLTYCLVEPPTLWVVLQVLMLAVFGAEVEKFIGRRNFLWHYLALVLAGPVLLAMLGFAGIAPVLYGANLVQFAVFVSFALLYPRAEIFFGLQARWVMLVLLGLFILQALAMRDLASVLLILWTSAIGAIMLWKEGFLKFPLPSPAVPKVHRRSREKNPSKHLPEEEPESLLESIDPILDKISKSGISSLTREERTRLERARARLIQKEESKH